MCHVSFFSWHTRTKGNGVKKGKKERSKPNVQLLDLSQKYFIGDESQPSSLFIPQNNPCLNEWLLYVLRALCILLPGGACSSPFCGFICWWLIQLENELAAWRPTLAGPAVWGWGEAHLALAAVSPRDIQALAVFTKVYVFCTLVNVCRAKKDISIKFRVPSHIHFLAQEWNQWPVLVFISMKQQLTHSLELGSVRGLRAKLPSLHPNTQLLYRLMGVSLSSP